MLYIIKKIIPNDIKVAIREEIQRIASDDSKNNIEQLVNYHLLQLEIQRIASDDSKNDIEKLVNSHLLNAPSIQPWCIPNIYEPIDRSSDVSMEIKPWNPQELSSSLSIKINGLSIYSDMVINPVPY